MRNADLLDVWFMAVRQVCSRSAMAAVRLGLQHPQYVFQL